MAVPGDFFMPLCCCNESDAWAKDRVVPPLGAIKAYYQLTFRSSIETIVKC